MELQEIISSVRKVYPSAQIQAGNNKWRGSHFLVQRLEWVNCRIMWIVFGDGETKDAAWESAWNKVSNEMLEKLEL